MDNSDEDPDYVPAKVDNLDDTLDCSHDNLANEAVERQCDGQALSDTGENDDRATYEIERGNRYSHIVMLRQMLQI